MKKNETNLKMLAKHPIINRKKRKSKKKCSSVKRALAKNAVNATRQSTVKTTAVDRQPYRHPCPRLPALGAPPYRKGRQPRAWVSVRLPNHCSGLYGRLARRVHGIFCKRSFDA